MQHFRWNLSEIGDVPDRFESSENVIARQRKKDAGVQKIGPAKHVENRVVAAVILGRIRLHPLANRPTLLLFFSRPRLVHRLSVLLPCGTMRERVDGACYGHAGQKVRGLIKSARVLGNGETAGPKQ